MTALFTQNFDIGPDAAALSPLSTESVAGTGTLTYSASNPITGAYGMLCSVSNNFAYLSHVLTAGTTGYWHGLSFTMPAVPTAVVYIMSEGTGATKAADVRINADNTITFRDQSTAKWTSPVIAATTRVRLAFKVIPGSSTGLRMRLYVGANYSGTTPDYDSGDFASTSALSTIVSAREGVIATYTGSYAIQFDAVSVDTTTEPSAPSPVNTDSGVTTPPALIVTEDFTTGPANSALVLTTGQSRGGTGTAVYDSGAPITGSFGAKFSVTGSTTFASLVHALGSRSGIWHAFSFVVPAYPTGTASIAVQGNGSTKVSDLRFNSDGSLSLRDVSTVITGATTGPLPVGQRVRVSVKCFPSSATGLRLRVYIGGNYSGTTPDFDSGDKASTSAETAVSFANEGISAVPTGTWTITLDSIRVDGGSEPAAPSPINALANAAPTVDAGGDQAISPWQTATLTAVGTDTDGSVASYTWRQISGPAVTLVGTGATRTLTVPNTQRVATDMVFGVTCTDNLGSTSTEDTVTVTALPVTEWAVVGGVEVPFQLFAY